MVLAFGSLGFLETKKDARPRYPLEGITRGLFI